MEGFFRVMYELLHLYSIDFANILHGYNCSQSYPQGGYIGSQIGYLATGLLLFATVILWFLLIYKWLDHPKKIRVKYWWFNALILAIVNYLIAMNFGLGAYYDFACHQYVSSANAWLGFPLTNAILSLFWYGLLTSIPIVRKISINHVNATFYH